MGLFKSLRRTKELPVETLDLETLRGRIGEPLPPKRPVVADRYVRADGPSAKTRSWRRFVGIQR